MGVVYKAQDAKLDRLVALKFLPPEYTRDQDAKQRFINEAKAASALDHPNICTIHEIGETPDGQLYIAMAFYEGETLQQKIAGRGEVTSPLRLDDALAYAIQTAEGLQVAHKKGIVHRDVKSSNIMVTTADQVKIMDFGLAKTTGATMLTKSGATVGTVPYMSPEQARGEKVDHRTDIWALGIVLYEMIAGKRPFRGEYEQAIIYQILHQNPEPIKSLRVDAPIELEHIVNKAMQKDVNARYQSIDAMLADLKSLKKEFEEGTTSPQSTTSTSRDRIAVLPFANISPDARDEYFADGMTEELITNLSKIGSLRVIARTSVMRYKGTNKSITDIGQELKVRTVLEGSVRKANNKVRISVQLIDTTSEEHIWVQDYDRELEDVFAIQSDIARRVAEVLKIQLGVGEQKQITKKPTVNIEAYEYYLRGIYHYKKSKIDNDIAIMMLERAVELDPTFALAHAALANAYTEKFFSYDPQSHWEKKASSAIERALYLEPSLAEASLAKGVLLWTLSNNFPHEKAITEFKRALSLKPNLVDAHTKLGLVYFHIGLYEKAVQELQIALELNPAHINALELLGMTYVYQQKYHDALSILEKLSKLDKDWTGSQIALALFYLGRVDEASAVLSERLQSFPHAPWLISTEAILLAHAGQREKAEEKIRVSIEHGKSLGHFHHIEHHIAAAYAIMGKTQEAIEWLNRAIDDGLPCYPLFANDPNLKNLHENADFQSLMKNLKQKWEYYKANL